MKRLSYVPSIAADHTISEGLHLNHNLVIVLPLVSGWREVNWLNISILIGCSLIFKFAFERKDVYSETYWMHVLVLILDILIKNYF